MLADHPALATIAVKNLAVARKFYRETLGLTAEEADNSMVLTYSVGGAKLIVYESKFAGTNHATSVTWMVGEELDRIVADLRAKGVQFEHYEFPGSKLEGDVHVSGAMRVAWFKDPDGNILNLGNGK